MFAGGSDQRRNAGLFLDVLAALDQLIPAGRDGIPAGLVQDVHVVEHCGERGALAHTDELAVKGVSVGVSLRHDLGAFPVGEVGQQVLLDHGVHHDAVVELDGVGQVVGRQTLLQEVCIGAETDVLDADPRMLLFEAGFELIPCIGPVDLREEDLEGGGFMLFRGGLFRRRGFFGFSGIRGGGFGLRSRGLFGFCGGVGRACDHAENHEDSQ